MAPKRYACEIPPQPCTNGLAQGGVKPLEHSLATQKIRAERGRKQSDRRVSVLQKVAAQARWPARRCHDRQALQSPQYLATRHRRAGPTQPAGMVLLKLEKPVIAVLQRVADATLRELATLASISASRRKRPASGMPQFSKKRDLLPDFRIVLSWNFPIMIPLTGEGEFHEEVKVFGGADRLHPASGR